jgi:hypothetical protein
MTSIPFQNTPLRTLMSNILWVVEKRIEQEDGEEKGGGKKSGGKKNSKKECGEDGEKRDGEKEKMAEKRVERRHRVLTKMVKREK